MPMTTEDLQPLVGYRARLWRFMATHDHLAIRLEPKTQDRVVFLVLSGCNHLGLPVAWEVRAPRVEIADPPWLLLVDEGVRVVCRDISLHDDYPW